MQPDRPSGSVSMVANQIYHYYTWIEMESINIIKYRPLFSVDCYKVVPFLSREVFNCLGNRCLNVAVVALLQSQSTDESPQLTLMLLVITDVN